jgi:uracil-DNA glycosylase
VSLAVASSYSSQIATFCTQQGNDWATLPFFQDGHALHIAAMLDEKVAAGQQILPLPTDVLNALVSTRLGNTRVIILGQDPYPTPGDAHGLAFSINRRMAIPRSLRNIFKEMQNDIGGPSPGHGNLQGWARQGVLLLNTCLTVEAGKAGSHRRLGWETLSDQMISAVSAQSDSAVFLLWGADAQRKVDLINQKRHLVLQAPHPSPLSARRGFFNSRPFSTTNAWLKACGSPEIDWRLSD